MLLGKFYAPTWRAKGIVLLEYPYVPTSVCSSVYPFVTPYGVKLNVRILFYS